MATPKTSKTVDTDRKGLLVQFRPATADFVRAACGTKPMSAFVRDASIAAASKVLQKTPPVVAEFGRGGRSTEITLLAQKAGMTTKEYMRKCTLEANGKKYEAPKGAPAVAPKAASK
jgi:hypothetical protein